MISKQEARDWWEKLVEMSGGEAFSADEAEDMTNAMITILDKSVLERTESQAYLLGLALRRWGFVEATPDDFSNNRMRRLMMICNMIGFTQENPEVLDAGLKAVDECMGSPKETSQWN